MEFTTLSQGLRYLIEKRLQSSQRICVIATAIGVHRSTLYRELKRGSVNGRYDAAIAQQRADRRRATSTANHPQKTAALWRAVGHSLRQDHSPEQFAGRLRAAGGLSGEQVSTQAIYNWLKRTKSSAVTHLRRYHKTQRWCARRGGLDKGRPRIKDRPKSVETRRDKRHWEGDTISGARGSTFVVATLIERKSLFTRLSPAVVKKATKVTEAIAAALAGTKARTLTVDNGSEFADYARLTEMTGTKVYFADPGQPRQRARNENNNGLIRQYLPKSSSLKKVTRAKSRWIENRLNDRPRKTLGYKTPREVFFNLKPTPVASRS